MERNFIYALNELLHLHANVQKIYGFIGNNINPSFFNEKIALHRCFQEEIRQEIAWLYSKDPNLNVKNIGFQTIQFYPSSYSDIHLLQECKMHLHIFSVTYYEALMVDYLPERTSFLLTRQSAEIQETISELKEQIQEIGDIKMAV